jgi:hypothetical protein
MPCKKYFVLAFIAFGLCFFNAAQACDTTPIVSGSNVQSIGGGNYTVDVQVCIGVNGSTNGFSTSINCGLNILATTPLVLTNGANAATATISGNTVTYNCATCNASNWFEPNDFTAGPCFNFTLTLNGNPENCVLTASGINDGCLFIRTSWTGNIPGPCVNAGSITAPASFSGNTATSSNSCNLRPSTDQIIQVNLPCNDLWTFSLCGTAAWDTYMYIGNACCSSNLGINDDACGLQSQITAAMGPGTIYVTIEGFGSSSAGTYTLNVSQQNSCPFDAGDIRLSATANEIENTIDLKWTVENEENVLSYIVERSIENGPYSSVGQMEAGGSGLAEYELQDWQVKAGELYSYRVHVHEISGSMYDSEIVTVMLGAANGLSAGAFFPNPATSKASIELRSGEEGRLDVSIYDTRGRVIAVRGLSVHAGSATASLDVTELPAGVYFVQMTDKYNNTAMRKLVVE